MNIQNIVIMQNEGDCFSENNFEKFYKLIENQISKGDKIFYSFADYDLYLSNGHEIRFKKDNYTLGMIQKEKGSLSLAKRQTDSDRIIIEINRIFCEILMQLP